MNQESRIKNYGKLKNIIRNLLLISHTVIPAKAGIQESTRFPIKSGMTKMRRGFTLVELLVVMAILGILLTGIIVAINPVRNINQGKDATVKFDMAQIVRALKAYQTITHGLYPEVGTPPLQNLVESGELDDLPKQPDGTDFNYQRSAVCDASGCEGIVWAKLYNAPDGTQWCWDSTSNKYKESPNPPAPSEITCP